MDDFPPAICHITGARPDYYKRYRSNIYSQNGEDGIIKKLFEDLNISGGYLCEFGAWDGKHLSNTYSLFHNNAAYVPILIEGDKDRYRDLVDNLGHIENAHLINKYIDTNSSGPNSLNNIIESLQLPDIEENFQLLSIDVDGIDYEIWESLTEYEPKIVVIEVNSELSLRAADRGYPGQPTQFFHDRLYDPNFGCSLAKMVDLSYDKGYEIVTHCGNAIFVREDLCDKLSARVNNLDFILDRWLKAWKHIDFQNLFPNAPAEGEPGETAKINAEKE